jgi:hypothetical protein
MQQSHSTLPSTAAVITLCPCLLLACLLLHLLRPLLSARKWYAVLDPSSNGSSIDQGMSLNAQLIKLPTTDSEDFQQNLKVRTGLHSTPHLSTWHATAPSIVLLCSRKYGQKYCLAATLTSRCHSLCLSHHHCGAPAAAPVSSVSQALQKSQPTGTTGTHTSSFSAAACAASGCEGSGFAQHQPDFASVEHGMPSAWPQVCYVPGVTLFLDFPFPAFPDNLGHWAELLLPLYSTLSTKHWRQHLQGDHRHIDRLLLLNVRQQLLYNWPKEVLGLTLSPALPPWPDQRDSSSSSSRLGWHETVPWERPLPPIINPVDYDGWSASGWMVFENIVVLQDRCALDTCLLCKSQAVPSVDP